MGWNIAILAGSAEQDVLEMMQGAPLTQPVQKTIPHVGGIAHAELQQGTRFFPLLHEPHSYGMSNIILTFYISINFTFLNFPKVVQNYAIIYFVFTPKVLHIFKNL